MIEPSMSIIVLVALVLVVITGISAYALVVAIDIFKGSGDPKTMSKILLMALTELVHVIFAVFSIAILIVILMNDLVTSDIVIPIIGTIIGYILGKGLNANIQNESGK